MRWIGVIALALIAFVPANAAGHLPVAPSVVHPASGSTGVFNYSTPDNSDVESVVVSPNGAWTAASTDNDQVLVFSSIGGNSGSISPTTTITLTGQARSMAISDSSSSGTPTLLIGVEGYVLAYAVNSNLVLWNFSGFYDSGNASITGVAISNAGTSIAAVATVTPPVEKGGEAYYSYVYFDGTHLVQWYNSSSSGEYLAVDVSMTVDGSRIVVGVDEAHAVGLVTVFTSDGAPPVNWSAPPSPIGSSGVINDAQIAGNGVAIYETSTTSFDATPNPSSTPAVSNLNSANLLAVSVDACNALVSSGFIVNYYNVSAAGETGCNATSFSPTSLQHPLWSHAFETTVTSIALATANPDYFVVAWSNEMQWFYAYPGMPQSDAAAYRTITTNGAINDIAMGNSGNVTVIGSRFVVGEDQEFVLAQDSGIPQYSPLTVTATADSPIAGASSATETISWSSPPQLGFEYIEITFASSAGGASVNPVQIGTSGQTTTTVSGFSFATAYTVNLELVTFGGAEHTASSSVGFTTSSAPPVQDPFMILEYLAIAVIIAGVVTFFVLNSRLPKSQPSAPAAPPPRPGSPAPPRSGPPGGYAPGQPPMGRPPMAGPPGGYPNGPPPQTGRPGGGP